jgi:hypothetical protein
MKRRAGQRIEDRVAGIATPAKEMPAADVHIDPRRWREWAPRADGTQVAYAWSADGYQIRREIAPDGTVRYFRKLSTW